jgi:hypothetical protein
MDKLAVALIGALPRCIHDSRRGLAQRCQNIGTHIVELPNGEREYGSQVCMAHINWAKKENPGATILQLRYAEPLIALAQKLGIKLVCDDPQLTGVEE